MYRSKVGKQCSADVISCFLFLALFIQITDTPGKQFYLSNHPQTEGSTIVDSIGSTEQEGDFLKPASSARTHHSYFHKFPYKCDEWCVYTRPRIQCTLVLGLRAIHGSLHISFFSFFSSYLFILSLFYSFTRFTLNCYFFYALWNASSNSCKFCANIEIVVW